MDGNRIIITTSESFLVLVAVEYKPENLVYHPPTLPLNAQRSFMAGPGEGHPLQSTILHFEGVIRVEGTLLSVSPRRHYLLFSTKNPSTIQRVPWPSDKENDSVESRRRPLGYDTWLLNGEDFSWFIDSDVSVNKIIFSRISSGEIWVTSDGRAYFVHLQEDIDNEISSDEVLFSGEVYHRDDVSKENQPEHLSRLFWQGHCIHDFETPKWVQKQRQFDPDKPRHERGRLYEEPRHAKAIAINAKFSLIAIGTLGIYQLSCSGWCRSTITECARPQPIQPSDGSSLRHGMEFRRLCSCCRLETWMGYFQCLWKVPCIRFRS